MVIKVRLVLFAAFIALSPLKSLSVEPDAITLYNQRLHLISRKLTNKNYYENYVKAMQDKTLPQVICEPSVVCAKSSIKRILLSVQRDDFSFISPVQVPADGIALFWDIKKLSSCQNIGFMNVRKMPGERGVDPVPWRPTRNFIIYVLPNSGRQLLLVRGGGYNLAWPFWGADQSGVKLPPLPSKNEDERPDFLTEIDSDSCHIVAQLSANPIETINEKNFQRSSFSAPIIMLNQIFLLQISGVETNNQPTVYDLVLTKLDTKRGNKAEIFYSTFFEG